MDRQQITNTLRAISIAAHELSKGSNPAQPSVRTKAEQVAALVERLSDTVKIALGVAPDDGGKRPPLSRADEVLP